MENKDFKEIPKAIQQEKISGLTKEQIEARKKKGLVNGNTNVKTKSIKSIIARNFFTIFNLMNFLLALAVFAVGSYKNMLFMGIVIINTAISTIQEIHSKRTIDKLSLIATSKVKALRSGKIENIEISEIVLDDILKFETGNQVVIDCIIEQGEVEVNESFITGEVEPVIKKVGDEILSGSFIVSGKIYAKVEHIGKENFTSKISSETKYIKRAKSEIITSLNQIIKIISVVIIPVGILLFLNQLGLEGNTVRYAVVNTVAAIIGMIPEGLILLTSTVLAVSVIRLAKSKVLVQELYCIETLARVDTLCLDKTGTITEGKMEVKNIILIDKREEKTHILDDQRMKQVKRKESKEELEKILSIISYYSQDNNFTIKAIRDRYNNKNSYKEKNTKENSEKNQSKEKILKDYKLEKEIPFSSDKKWSGMCFKEKGSYILGAPEIILKENYELYKEEIEQYTVEYRVILIAHSEEMLYGKELPQNIEAIGIILISDKIRETAKETLQYFKNQGVNIRIISGDNPITVSKIAKQAGVENYDKYIDCSSIKTEEQLKNAVKKYTIFGRVLPNQKKQIVHFLKQEGHTVAMTGDGVNDIIALKEADCSIAMASGSDAAKCVSQLVLLDSNFASMPKIVAEGRRTINNIERSATLFLSKTLYSTMLAILFVFIQAKYPFMPIQLSLIALVCIGIPSFVLALEPNNERVKGKFIGNVISKSIPTALTVVINIIITTIIAGCYNLPLEVYSTICIMLTVLTGFSLLVKISMPFNLIRGVLLGFVIFLFVCCSIILKDLFTIVLPMEYIGLILILGLTCICNFIVLNFISRRILVIIRMKRRKKLRH